MCACSLYMCNYLFCLVGVFTGHQNSSYYIKTALSVCGRLDMFEILSHQHLSSFFFLPCQFVSHSFSFSPLSLLSLPLSPLPPPLSLPPSPSLSHYFRFLLSGSSCKNALIWDTQNSQAPPTLLVGHTREVTAVAWCPTQLNKVTDSDSMSCDYHVTRL